MDFQVVWFEGDYQDYEADRHKRLATDPTSRTESGPSRRRLRLCAASPVMALAICPGFMCLATAISRTVCAARIFAPWFCPW